MATRSTIALEYADGTVDQVYCHWDGYLSHNGEILRKHYTDPFKVQQLMDLGDISSLGQDIGEKHDFSRLDSPLPADEYERLYGNMVTFYGRDRGETGTDRKRFADFEDYKKNHQYEEYEYILRKDGVWYVSPYGKSYVALDEAIAKEAEELEAEDA